MAMAGIADRELRVGGFLVDRMSSDHWRTMRLLSWEIAVWNLNYFQGIASRYVKLTEEETRRAGHVRDQLDVMKNSVPS